MFGGSFDGWAAAKACPVPVPDFRGSYWGVVGNKITRLPEYVREPGELKEPSGDYYTYPSFNVHPTHSVELPNLTDGEGIERECFGAACSMYADGAWRSITGGASHVYFWCHYVPVGESSLDNAMAAFARLKVADYFEGKLSALVPANPTVWLVPDEGKWDDRDKLNVQDDYRKAFVGANHVGWIEKKPNQNLKLRYYGAGNSTPTVVDIPNAATAEEDSGGFQVVEVSTNKFPLALFCKTEVERFPDTTLKRVKRFFQIGEYDDGTHAQPRGMDSDLWDARDIFSYTAFGEYNFSRQSESSIPFPTNYTKFFIRDWEIYYGTDFEDQPGDPEPKVVRRWNDAGIVHSAANGASPPTPITNTTTANDLDGKWYHQVIYSGAASLFGDAFEHGVDGSADPPRAGVNHDGPIIGATRIYPAYYGYEATDLGSTASAFVVADNARDEFAPNNMIVSLAGEENDQASFEDQWFMRSSFYGGISTDGGFPYLTLMRVPAFPRIIDAGTGFEGVPPTPYVRLFADGYNFEFVDAADPDPSATRTVGPGWSAPLHSDGAAPEYPATFYDDNVRVYDDDYETMRPQDMPAPSGFWEDANGDVQRGRFCVQIAYDTMHPTNAMIADPSVGYDD